MIRVAALEILHRHAVIGGDHHIRLEIQRRNPVADRIAKRLDIFGIVEIGRRRPHRRLPAHGFQRIKRLVIRRRRRRRRILRIKRHQQDLLAPGRLHPLQHRSGRGIAIAHGKIHHDAIATQPLGQAFGLLAGNHPERAFVLFLVPDLGIGMPALLRPEREDDQIEDRPPQQLVGLDHPRIGEEFLQIPPHAPVIGGVGGPQIKQQHPDLLLGHRRMVRWKMSGHRGPVWKCSRVGRTIRISLPGAKRLWVAPRR